MFETLIFAVILLMLNLILVYRPIPIFAFPIELFTLYLYVTQFLPSSALPMQPFFTVFLIIVNVLGLITNSLSLREN